MKIKTVVCFGLLIGTIHSLLTVDHNLSAGVSQRSSAPRVLVATFSGIISPVSAEFLGQSIDRANSENFDALVIRLDTPGGLDLSMREIIKKILASKVPVILYVFPAGARAASAGVFLAMASHVVAMSPGTNIGAAHPVMIGSPGIGGGKGDGKDKKSSAMEEKILNDASAYIKSITQERKRNVDWAIRAVTHSDSISAEEAVEMKVIDLIASGTRELLDKVDGMEIPKIGRLYTKNAELVYNDPTTRQKWLSAITDPNVAMLLMSIGAAGIFIEMYNPGLILPGVVGAISLVVAFYSFQTLSANYAGIVLILLGFIFFIAEIKVLSYGLLTVGGIISVLLGVLMLFNNPASMGLSVSWGIIVTSLGSLMAVVFGVGWLVINAHKRGIAAGIESLTGKAGLAKTALNPSGTVLVEGELWDATSLEGEIPQGAGVKVEAVEGFKIKVSKN